MDNRIENRNVQMDLLRVVACIMVIVIHVVMDGFSKMNVHSSQSAVLTFYNNICRAAVPIFFMFSGMFSRSTNWKKSLKKAFWFLLMLVAVTALYYAVEVYANHYIYCIDTRPLFVAYFQDFTMPKYHLWFLPMYIALLIWTPAINALLGKNRVMLNYLTAAFLIGTVGVQTIKIVFYDQPLILLYIDAMPDFSMGYVGYYILGRFVYENMAWFRKWRKAFCALGMISLALAYIGTRKVSLFENQSTELFYHHMCVLILLEAIGWIMLFDGFRIPLKWHGTIAWLKKHSLFIYLAHVFIVDVMTWCGFSACSIHPVLGVPLMTTAVFAACCALCGMKDLVMNGLRKCIAGNR